MNLVCFLMGELIKEGCVYSCVFVYKTIIAILTMWLNTKRIYSSSKLCIIYEPCPIKYMYSLMYHCTEVIRIHFPAMHCSNRIAIFTSTCRLWFEFQHACITVATLRSSESSSTSST